MERLKLRLRNGWANPEGRQSVENAAEKEGTSPQSCESILCKMYGILKAMEEGSVFKVVGIQTP